MKRGGGRMTFTEWCKQSGYTSQQLANMVGVSKKSIDAYRQGARTPTRRIENRLKSIGMPAGMFDQEEKLI